MEKTKFIRVIGFINGEDIKQDIPISSIDKNEKTLDVDLKTDIENEIVEADTPDEFVMREICRALSENSSSLICYPNTYKM